MFHIQRGAAAMSDENEDTDDTLVIQEQPRTEIYWGRNGHLVIKQTDPLGNDDPPLIFTPGAVPELIRLLQREYDSYVAKDSPGQPAPMPPPQPVAPPRSTAPPTPERMPQKPKQKKGAEA